MKHLITIVSIIAIFATAIFLPYYTGLWLWQRVPPLALETNCILWFEGFITLIIGALAIILIITIYVWVYNSVSDKLE